MPQITVMFEDVEIEWASVHKVFAEITYTTTDSFVVDDIYRYGKISRHYFDERGDVFCDLRFVMETERKQTIEQAILADIQERLESEADTRAEYMREFA